MKKERLGAGKLGCSSRQDERRKWEVDEAAG